MTTFHEEYSAYLITMKALGLLTVLITVFLVYLVIFKSQKLTVHYKMQLAYNIIIASILHIFLSLLFIPVQILPATVFCSEGILKEVVPGSVFFPVFGLLLCVFAGSVLPLFHYRLRILLPEEHFLNSTAFHWAFHFLFYIGVFIIPVPFMLLTFKKLIPLKQLELSGLPRVEAHCVGYNFAHWDSFTVLGVLLFSAGLFLVIIATFTIWTHKLLKIARVHMSKITVQEHRVVFFALINTITVYSSFYVFPCLIEVGSIIIKKGSIGLATTCTSIFTSSFIFSSITMIISNKPYRMWILSFLKSGYCALRTRRKIRGEK